MHDQRIGVDGPADGPTGPTEEHTDGVVLGLMLDGGSWPWSVEEIARELGQRLDGMDAVSRLTEAGLLHRFGDFVFPTRAARRAREIHDAI
jgi:hypothetical protein